LKTLRQSALILALLPTLGEAAFALEPDRPTNEPPAAASPAPAPPAGTSTPLPQINVSGAPAKPRQPTLRQPGSHVTTGPRRATSPARPQAAPSAPAAQAAPAPASGTPNAGAGPLTAPALASQMSVTGDDLNARPVTRPGELLEAAPGLSVTQHSGEGKANQYFLRDARGIGLPPRARSRYRAVSWSAAGVVLQWASSRRGSASSLPPRSSSRCSRRDE
jgi:hypothetical protein